MTILFNQNKRQKKLLSQSKKRKKKKKKRKTLTFIPSDFESNVHTFKIIPKIWMKDLDNI